jgi:hypothetical protein
MIMIEEVPFETDENTLEEIITYYANISRTMEGFKYGPAMISLIHFLAQMASDCEDHEETLNFIIKHLKDSYKIYRERK